MEELRNAIALLYKRKGRDSLTEREFVLSASMDLRWFPPRDAQRLLQVGLETKLLESRDGTIRPVFDVSTVEVPRDYVPTTAILAMPTPLAEDQFVARADGSRFQLRDHARPLVDLGPQVRLFPPAGLPGLANPPREVLHQFEVAPLFIDVLRRHPPLAGLQPLGDHRGHRARPQGGARHLLPEAGALPAHGEDRRVDGDAFQPRDVGSAQFADQENSPVKTK